MLSTLFAATFGLRTGLPPQLHRCPQATMPDKIEPGPARLTFDDLSHADAMDTGLTNNLYGLCG